MSDKKIETTFIGILDGDDTVNKSQSISSQQDNTATEINSLYATENYPVDTLQKFMASLDTTTLKGMEALDEAVRACSNFSSAQEAIDQMISDLKTLGSSKFLTEKCGIVLNNTDTGAITGADAGGTKIKTAESIVPEDGDPTYPEDTTFTIRGLTVTVPEKDSLTADQQIIVQGLYSWWIDECMNLIEESYGYSFNDTDVTVATINVDFDTGTTKVLGSNILAAVGYNYFIEEGTAFKLTLYINTNNFFKNLSATNVNGSTSSSGLYLDRTLAHELTHAIMAAKIDHFAQLPIFLKEGMAEITHGIDDFRKSTINGLVGSPTTLKNSLDLTNLNSGTVNNYAGGYIFLRYLAEQGATQLVATEVLGDETFSGNTNYEITAGGTYTLAAGYSGVITINTNDAVIIDGSSAGNLSGVYIRNGSGASKVNLTIKDLNVTNNYDSVIYFNTTNSNSLNIEGTNSLSNSNYKATINIGNGLTISGTGSLTATAGANAAAIGTDAEETTNTSGLTISSGTVTAVSNGNGAAIGSGAQGSMGAIVITGGTVTATSNSNGAAIGSGDSGTVSSISISGGTTNATAYNGAGVGSGASASSGPITIDTKATVTATSRQFGAGIGAGYALSGNSSVGNINIGGDAQVTATSSANGVGIGEGAANGSWTSTSGTISLENFISNDTDAKTVINNSDVGRSVVINGVTYTGSTSLTFTDAEWTGQVSTKSVTIDKAGTYTIPTGFSGEIIIATTDAVTIDGTGKTSLNGMTITTTVENVNLTIKNLNIADTAGSVITLGTGTLNKLTFAGDSTLSTTAESAAAINVGGGVAINSTSDATLTVSATNGAAIGTDAASVDAPDITISALGSITATATQGAAIGSGNTGKVGNINIQNTTINATANEGAGIGSGRTGASVGDISITSATITAKSTGGAGIGSGTDGSTTGSIKIQNAD